MNAGQGTTKTGNVISVDNDTVLTHGSFNHATGYAFVKDPDVADLDNPYLNKGVDANAVDPLDDSWIQVKGVKITDKATPTPQERTVNVYNAISWSMTFTYTFASDATPVGIYLDLGQSVFKDAEFVNGAYDFTSDAKDGDTSLLKTAKGFRIAFYGAIQGNDPYAVSPVSATGARNVVWGNNTPITGVNAYANGQDYAVGAKVHVDGVVYQAKEAMNPSPAAFDSSKWKPTGEIVAAGNHYVSSTATALGTYDSAVNYVVHNPIVKPTEGYYQRVEPGSEHTTWQAGERAERLCVLSPGVATSTVTVKCAAWYEGTDPNVVTGSAMQSLSAAICVYARTLGAA